MSDLIKTLPVDDNPVTVNEMKIVDNLFQAQKKNLKSIFFNLKDIILAGIIFVLISLPFVDNILGGFLNFVKNSSVMMILAKAVVFMVVLFIAQNFILAKKA